jgi:murein tripeptide amidase MpaA
MIRPMIRPLPAASALATMLVIASPTLAQQQIDAEVDLAWNRYYELDEVGEILERLAAAHPELATLESIGESHEGRPMWVFTINNPQTGPDTSKPGIYVDGSIHANEIQSTETVL